MKLFLYFLFLTNLLTFQNFISAQNTTNNRSIDVQHYQFEITVNDSTNIIEGIATITLKINNAIKEFNLDLISLDENEKGMSVSQVLNNNRKVPFQHNKNKLNIQIPSNINDSIKVFTIKYHGIPKDGLIISKNKFGDRTFFGDNWPTRAKNWLPCVDELSDKATVDFIVKAPSYYQVIANGTLIEEVNLNDQIKLYHYSSKNLLPTYLMVIGVARFAVQYLGEFNQTPLSTWVYPQNKKEGFYDYAQAIPIIEYYVNHIAPFPFSKLANVQSKTRFGGMENASAIFYSEKSVTGKRNQEALLAHEIAHQWFGDSATEREWPHLWLSEGFATYFTSLYFENKYGKEKLNERLINERNKIIRFSEKQQTPVIDTKTKNYMKLLNANSYEKGAWFLHMLRTKIGDELFWKSIKEYYKKYQFDNAVTEDFRSIVESFYNKDLSVFFDQWLYGIGQPELDLQWKNKSNEIDITINQTQKTKTIFDFPLELLFKFDDGSTKIKTLSIDQKKQTFTFPIHTQIIEIVIDPNVSLLYKSK
ncbi:MAG: M1 family metallopeptidase [Bacteroidota bacterium]